mmetsp:Transcript_119723/g.298617  ORF Transcript_119723/g.298617 Transcript_119723/m.298617 type:complete len:255 (+) Transcript_119723:179-943(+)
MPLLLPNQPSQLQCLHKLEASCAIFRDGFTLPCQLLMLKDVVAICSSVPRIAIPLVRNVLPSEVLDSRWQGSLFRLHLVVHHGHRNSRGCIRLLELADTILQRRTGIVHLVNDKDSPATNQLPNTASLVKPLLLHDLRPCRLGGVVVELQAHRKDGHLDLRAQHASRDEASSPDCDHDIGLPLQDLARQARHGAVDLGIAEVDPTIRCCATLPLLSRILLGQLTLLRITLCGDAWVLIAGHRGNGGHGNNCTPG